MSNIVKHLVWYSFGGCAFAARMLVVAVGCLFLTVAVTGWTEFSWRFWTVFGLVFMAYVVASAIEFMVDLKVKNATQERK